MRPFAVVVGFSLRHAEILARSVVAPGVLSSTDTSGTTVTVTGTVAINSAPKTASELPPRTDALDREDVLTLNQKGRVECRTGLRRLLVSAGVREKINIDSGGDTETLDFRAVQIDDRAIVHDVPQLELHARRDRPGEVKRVRK